VNFFNEKIRISVKTEENVEQTGKHLDQIVLLNNNPNLHDATELSLLPL
jgi:hypothetical protein